MGGIGVDTVGWHAIIEIEGAHDLLFENNLVAQITDTSMEPGVVGPNPTSPTTNQMGSSSKVEHRYRKDCGRLFPRFLILLDGEESELLPIKKAASMGSQSLLSLVPPASFE